VLPHLERPPCYVSFSGGRDSSLVLAVATMAARKAGLEDPIPVTERYPLATKADEDEWQELVIRALGLGRWHKFRYTSENDLLGERAQSSLRRYGILWPSAIHVKPNLLGHVRGGSLLTGEGGDAVFRVQRSTALRNLRTVERTGPSRLDSWHDAWDSVKPRRTRYRAAWREYSERMAELTPWLTVSARTRFLDLIASEKAAMPLTYRPALLALAAKRDFVLGQSNYRRVARDFDVTVVDPLLDLGFLNSLGTHYGLLSPHSRTSAMLDLFDHLLPTAILARNTKSFFQEAVLGEPTRQFAREWSGEGLNPEYVNAQVLKREWQAGTISPMGEFLLQQAWLYEQGLGIDGKPLQPPKAPTPQSTSPAEPPELATP